MSEIIAIESLKGTISGSAEIKGTVTVARDYDIYDGEYEVTPNAHKSQTLETADKLLKENVTIAKVPYWETSNPSGGNTIYIADETQINLEG